MARWIVLLVKILSIGLLIHFLVHTLMSYGFGVELGPVRAWKEIVIALLFFLVIIGCFMTKKWKLLFTTHHGLLLLCSMIGGGILLTLLMHVLHIDEPITRRAMAMRYDYLGFVLLALGWSATLFLDKELPEKLLLRYGRVIKWVLVTALVWWCIVAIKPGTLKPLGFNNYVFEGTVGMQPPAVYYTHINYGLPRSQFRFERPTTFGFWLTAFFPLFFMQFLRRRPRYETRAWRSLYGINVIITFSRAAWGSRIIAVVLCIGLTSNLPWKKLILRYGLPLFLLFTTILAVGREQIALRGYSNYGHMTMVKRGREMFAEKPLRGWGGASVGPGSHRDGGLAFNPENQFLQLLIEFGIIGALPRLLLRGRAVRIGIFSRRKYNKRIMAFSLGMVTLTVSGMVLHSFADRMVVYPFMLLFGIALGSIVIGSSSQNQTVNQLSDPST